MLVVISIFSMRQGQITDRIRSRDNHLLLAINEVVVRSMPSARRFPPPWTLDEANEACFIVRDHNGQALA
ncbi:MAG: hypothetical protein P4L80_16010 [Xanthobacteraceae bacterium]|nr:hypothetical protein [Xanthobacteraceae bacterium]